MMRMLTGSAAPALIALFSGSVFCQSTFSQTTEPPLRFEIADVHVSPKTTGRFQSRRALPARGGRYEITNATMVDLISIAYGFGDDKILGGPTWLEMDRFDVIAKVPPDSTPETQKLMLQSLLADRFHLEVRKETQPQPTFALVSGKKPQLKSSDGTGETGCRPDTSSGPATEGGIKLMTSTNGAATTISLGPGGVIQFHCRNMSMAAFAEGLGRMMGTGNALGPNPVLDQTGLEGRWNFDVKWSIGIFGPMMSQGERITVFDAMEKQLGMKLEPRQVPTPVLVVAGANRTPSANPPGVAEALPPFVAPTEFEVADVKPAPPGGRGGAFRFQPGGRVSAQNRPMSLLLIRAFGTLNRDELVGVPSWADSTYFDINAKAPSQGPSAPVIDFITLAPMLRALLAERFGLKYHTEERPATVYSLVAAKPKLKKADPASRTRCDYPTPPPGAPPGSQVLSCQNVTIAEFAEQLQGMTQELKWPVSDATGIEGRWDLTLTYSQNFAMMAMAPGGGGRGGDAGAPGADLATASDPSGGITIFQAIEKQLGLKLEAQKRPMPVTVIDHLEQKPTDN